MPANGQRSTKQPKMESKSATTKPERKKRTRKSKKEKESKPKSTKQKTRKQDNQAITNVIAEMKATLDYYQTSFEGETLCFDETNQIYIPPHFDPLRLTPQTQQMMLYYYETYGFVVLRDTSTSPIPNASPESPTPEDDGSLFTKTHPFNYWTKKHVKQINDHLKKVFENQGSISSAATSSHNKLTKEDLMIKQRAIPMKLNIGLINGTMYEKSSNSSTVVDKNGDQTDDIDDMMDTGGDSTHSMGINSIDDSISQSLPTWILRAGCLFLYTAFYNLLQTSNENLESPSNLIASIEDSTCMFSASSNLAKMQSDCLHFLPGLISERKSQKELRQLKTAAVASDRGVPVASVGRAADLDFSQYINYEERQNWPRGFLSTSNHNSSFSFIPGFQKIFVPLKKYMEDTHYGSKRTTTRAIPPSELQLDAGSLNKNGDQHLGRVKRVLLEEGDLLIYHPTFVTKLQANVSDETHAYGLKLMFFNPEKRGFTGFDYSSRRMAAAYSYVNNDERVFGHTFFLKRRGTTFMLNGTFTPKFNPLVYPYDVAASLAARAANQSHKNKAQDDPVCELMSINSTLFYWARNIIDRHYSRSIVSNNNM